MLALLSTLNQNKGQEVQAETEPSIKTLSGLLKMNKNSQLQFKQKNLRKKDTKIVFITSTYFFLR